MVLRSPESGIIIDWRLVSIDVRFVEPLWLKVLSQAYEIALSIV